ncbi:MAG: DUF1015 domain-containing protein [Methanomassiliicoccaceae archaeon]|nr:DUF1015 domain-containing protein [Methanomassiliicoccaceae archaeon]
MDTFITVVSMVDLVPFSGYRPSLRDGENIGSRISPPYDVIDTEYLERLRSDEHNVTHLTLNPVNGRYSGSRKTFDSWIADGSLIKDKDSFYLYKQKFTAGGRTMTRTGIVGALRTEPYENGGIIPHEETFSKVKEDRLNLLRDTETHLESIFGIFEGLSEGLNARIERTAEKLYVYEDDGKVEHSFFRISDKDVTDSISEEMKERKMLIADGHHRYETALNYSLEHPDDIKKGYVLATLVSSDDPGLVIWPTHRLLNSDCISETTAVKKIGEVLQLKETSSIDEMIGELTDWHMGLLFRSGKCYLARYNGSDDPLWSLDTYIAQELIIKGIYGYEEGEVIVSFDAEFGSVKKRMEKGKHDLAIILNTPSLKKIWDLSAIGKRMPKKTTYFYPKIWSGFVFYEMR